MNWHFDTKINLETKYNLFYYNPTYTIIPFFPIESENYLNKQARFHQIVEFKKHNFTGPILYCYCDPNRKYDMVKVWGDAVKYIETNLDLSDINISFMHAHIITAIKSYYKGDFK